MVLNAVAQAAVFALRQKIAKIEGALPERLSQSPAGEAVLRRKGIAVETPGLLRTGAIHLDNVLGGGLPEAALTEIHGGEVRDAGAVAAFSLALAGLLLNQGEKKRLPILWIGINQVFAEMGFPYAPGLVSFCGISPEEFLVAPAPKLVDALWIAEEAARLKELSAVFLELQGNPNRVDLTATRRLHRRAQLAGRPVFLLRQAGNAEPTAAPVRLIVRPAPATPRTTLAGPLADSIGRPAFAVKIGKSRTALPREFILEWNPHERAFQERQPENSRPLVSAPFLRPGFSPAPGEIVAFKPSDKAGAADLQSPGKQHPAHRHARRTG
jgi:protein ImuA